MCETIHFIMRKGYFISGNFLLILSGILFYLLQAKSIHNVIIFDYIFNWLLIALVITSILLIVLNFPSNWKRKYFVLVPSLILTIAITITSVMRTQKLFNSDVLFEASSIGEGFGAIIIVLRTDSTYKIEDLGLFGNNYYYGEFEILKDTLVLNPPSPNDLFASGRFLITTDTLFEFGNEGQLITTPEYAYEIFTTDSTD